MALTTIQTAQSAIGFNFQAQGAAQGADYQPNTVSGNPKRSTNYTKGAATAGQINEIYSKILAIAPSGSTTLDLTSLADVLGNTVSFARVKGWLIRLLSAVDDTTFPGTAASSITIGNAATAPFLFNGWSGATVTVNVNNGGAFAYDEPSAAGLAVAAGNKNVKIVNNDAGVAAAVQVTIWGADA